MDGKENDGGDVERDEKEAGLDPGRPVVPDGLALGIKGEGEAAIGVEEI